MPKHGHKRGWRRWSSRAKLRAGWPMKMFNLQCEAVLKVLWDKIVVRTDMNFFKERQHA